MWSAAWPVLCSVSGCTCGWRASSPLLAFIAIVGFSTTFGLMAGGFIALRPDHIFLISQLRSALRENRWVVVAHPVNREQAARAKGLLLQSQAEVHSTL